MASAAQLSSCFILQRLRTECNSPAMYSMSFMHLPAAAAAAADHLKVGRDHVSIEAHVCMHSS
jgi:hypothetical protein